MKRSCQHPLCPNYAIGSNYCQDHKPASIPTLDSNFKLKRKLYQSSGWKHLRARILRLEPRCDRCLLLGQLNPATDVDHIVPHQGLKEIFFEANNLQGLCHSCHSYKTNMEMKGRLEDYRNNCSYDIATGRSFEIIEGQTVCSPHRIAQWLRPH